MWGWDAGNRNANTPTTSTSLTRIGTTPKGLMLITKLQMELQTNKRSRIRNSPLIRTKNKIIKAGKKFINTNSCNLPIITIMLGIEASIQELSPTLDRTNAPTITLKLERNRGNYKVKTNMAASTKTSPDLLIHRNQNQEV